MNINTYQIFDFPPNWADSVVLTYSFNTALWESEHYREQRMPIKALPCSKMSYSILADKNAPTIWNYLQQSLNSIVYVPIWTEPIIPVTQSGTPGWNSITTNYLANYFNLYNLTRDIILIDQRQLLDPVVIALSSSSSTGLSTAGCSFAAPVASTIIYPALLAILDSITKTDETTDICTMQLNFREYTDGGGP